MNNDGLDGLEISWESTDHEWDAYGYDAAPPDFLEEELHARALVTWKRISLTEFATKVFTAAYSVKRFVGDPSLVTGAILAFSAANLFPLDIRIVRRNASAKEFVDLIKQNENGEQYVLREELAKFDKLEPLIQYYINSNVIGERDDRYVIRGRVLNKCFVE